MPLYSYQCDSCGNEFDLRQSFSAEPTYECPVCTQTARRRIQAVGVIYKGSGFYTTDYARKSDPGYKRSKEASGSSSSSSSSSEKSSSSSESDTASSSSESSSSKDSSSSSSSSTTTTSSSSSPAKSSSD